MPFLERLGAFAGKRLTEERVALRQRHHTEHDLDLAATINGLRLAEIELCLARRMRQRHENLGHRTLVASNCILHDGDTARISVLAAKPFEDSLAGVALLRMDLLVGLQNLMNNRDERPNRRLASHALLAIAWRLFVAENLLNRSEIQIVLLAGLTPAHAADEYLAADLCPLVHVGNHSFPSRS